MNDQLTPNEQVIIDSGLHWLVFLWPLIITGALTYFILKVHTLILLDYAALAIIVYVLLEVFIRYATTRFILTSARIIKKQGLLFTQSFDMRLNRIESVNLQQTLFGKMFGYGDLVVNGTGGERILLPLLFDAQLFQNNVFEAMDKKQ